jgi:hypothetical protein
MKKAPGSSETSVLTRVTLRNNPEDTILHSHRLENLKSYIWNIISIRYKLYESVTDGEFLDKMRVKVLLYGAR